MDSNNPIQQPENKQVSQRVQLLSYFSKTDNSSAIKDASPELLHLLENEFGKCEALELCKERGYCGQCCCRVQLQSKVNYKPTEPSPKAQKLHYLNFMAADLYLIKLKDDGHITEDEYNPMWQQLLPLQFEVGTEPYQLALTLYKQLKQAKECSLEP